MKTKLIIIALLLCGCKEPQYQPVTPAQSNDVWGTYNIIQEQKSAGKWVTNIIEPPPIEYEPHTIDMDGMTINRLNNTNEWSVTNVIIHTKLRPVISWDSEEWTVRFKE